MVKKLRLSRNWLLVPIILVSIVSPPLILCWLIIIIIKNLVLKLKEDAQQKALAKQKADLAAQQAKEQQTPDTPENFGYKVSWMVIRTEDTKAVAKSLGLTEICPCNWRYGMKYIDEGNYTNAEGVSYDATFVSPPVEGWTLVFGIDRLLQDLSEVYDGSKDVTPQFPHILLLSRQYGEVQIYASMRVSDAYAWALFKDGTAKRVFISADGQFKTLGRQTAVERNFHFFDINDPDSKEDGYYDREDLSFPCEEDVLTTARSWGIDPETLESLGVEPALGLVGHVSI